MAIKSKVAKIASAREICGDEQRFLTRDEVLALTTVSYPCIWAWMQQGKFPLAREISANRIGWLASDIRAWMEGRPVRKIKGA